MSPYFSITTSVVGIWMQSMIIAFAGHHVADGEKAERLWGQYTGWTMDRVRFGRALGYGARHAAKSLMQAADAATTPNPAPAPRTKVVSSSPRPANSSSGPQASKATQTARTVIQTKKHAKALGRSVWSPLAKFSSVVWLQVTGVFFTLLALFLSQGLWKERGAARLPVSSHAAVMFYLHGLAFAVFAYFAIGNFVRAHLRDRR
jgi:hypothetical protein